MSLNDFFVSTDKNLGQFLTDVKPVINKTEIKSKIRRLRAILLVHSYFYYVKDDPKISDDEWQEAANRLRDIQKENPDCCRIDFFDRHFSNWTGDTGFHLPMKDPWVIGKSEYLLKIWDKY